MYEQSVHSKTILFLLHCLGVHVCIIVMQNTILFVSSIHRTMKADLKLGLLLYGLLSIFSEIWPFFVCDSLYLLLVRLKYVYVYFFFFAGVEQLKAAKTKLIAKQIPSLGAGDDTDSYSLN